MAIDYNGLKKITSASIVDGAITASDLGSNAVTNVEIANGNVTAAKLATNAVNLGTTVVTGTLPVAKGGLGTTNPFGGAYRTIISNGSAISSKEHGVQGMQVFTGSGTWNRPSNVRYIKVQITGGGGGGSGHGESGGAGGYSEKVIDVSSISSVSVSISGESNGTYYSGAGGNGGGSSFGPYLSAGGGYGANRNNQHSGGLGGVGSGGNVNTDGGGGTNHHGQSCWGGSSFWGGSTAAGHPQGGNFSHNHQSHSAPGSGGAGGYFHGHRGSNGRPGYCVVTNYY